MNSTRKTRSGRHSANPRTANPRTANPRTANPRTANARITRTAARARVVTVARAKPLTRKRLRSVPEAVPVNWRPHMGFVPEGNLLARIEEEDVLRSQTIDASSRSELGAPLVRYRPKGYTVQLEGISSPRELLLVTFPEPLNLLKFCDTDGRLLVRDYIPFYRSTATSTTSILEELRDTWFPTFGMTENYELVKVSSLVTKKGFTLSWQPILDPYVRLQLKLNRHADQKQNEYVYRFGIKSDPHLLMKELAARTCSWVFLKMSASIGGGIWTIEQSFREFVLTHSLVSMSFVPDVFPAGYMKSPVFKTTQIHPVSQEQPLLRCRLDPVFNTVQRNDAVMVTYHPVESTPEVEL